MYLNLSLAMGEMSSYLCSQRRLRSAVGSEPSQFLRDIHGSLSYKREKSYGPNTVVEMRSSHWAHLPEDPFSHGAAPLISID